MLRELRGVVDAKLIGFVTKPEQLDMQPSPDHVLLLLTAQILQPPSLEQIQRVLSYDKEHDFDRITAVYDENKWAFGSEEYNACKLCDVKQCLNNHEAIIYRPLGTGRNEHEFKAMKEHLFRQIIQRSQRCRSQTTRAAQEDVSSTDPRV